MYNDLLNYPLKEHQEFGVKYSLDHHYSINGYKMGNGKTLVGITVSLFTGLPTLVVCPATLKLNWESEFNTFSKKKLKIKVLYSRDLKTFMPTNEDVIIINYAILPKAKELFKWCKLIIADEHHYLGNPKALRTKAFYSYILNNKPERLLMLSGSPIRGRVAQWYSPIKMCEANPARTSGNIFDGNHFDFQLKFSYSNRININGRFITKFYGIRNEDKLRDLLKNKFLRKAPNFELDLPDLVEMDIPIDKKINEKELKEAWEVYTETNKMSDHISSAKKGNAILKVPFTYSFVKDIIESGQGPVIIYSDHVQPLHDLQKLYKTCKITTSLISGSVDTKKRQKFITDYQKGSIDVFLATIGAASTGITLTRGRIMVFNDKSWINTENAQALKRFHRIGQTKDCVAYSIISGKTDKMIQKVNKEKDEVVLKSVDFL